MSRLGLRRPSPALVISLIALFVALGGTGYAAFKLPKNSVGSKQIKKNAVTGSKIKANSITGSKVKNGSLTGADLKLGSLGTVPSASNATNAVNATNAGHAGSADNATHAGDADTVGGIVVRSFSVLGDSSVPDHQVLDLDGLQISASCSGGAVTLTATTTSDGSELSAYSHDASNSDNTTNELGFFDDDFQHTESHVLPQTSHSYEVGQARFSGANGKFVDLTYNEDDSLPSGNCLAHGFAFGT